MTGNVGPLRVHAPDGSLLEGDLHEPSAVDGRVKGTVLALHAMMVDRRSMDRPEGRGLATTLAEAGWRVLRADFRGRGADGRPSRRRDWRYEDLVLQDVPTWLRVARSLGPGPVVVVGHSLGGHVTAASVAAGVARPDALAMLAANVWMPQLEPDPARRVRKRLVVDGFSGLATVLGRVPARALRVGPADEARGYARDLAVPMRTGRWGTRDGAQDWWSDWRRADVPVAAWVAAGDRLLAHEDGAGAFARQGGAKVFRVGDGGCGVDGRPDHMGLVTDPASEPAWRHVEAWMSGCTRPGA